MFAKKEHTIFKIKDSVLLLIERNYESYHHLTPTHFIMPDKHSPFEFVHKESSKAAFPGNTLGLSTQASRKGTMNDDNIKNHLHNKCCGNCEANKKADTTAALLKELQAENAEMDCKSKRRRQNWTRK